MTISFDEIKTRELMLGCIILGSKAPRELRYPHVGAMVIFNDGEIISKGYKKFIDHTSMTIHAERDALLHAGDQARGQCLITTLEPCYVSNKSKRTIHDCCSKLILDSGIETVIFGVEDNSPTVSNRIGINYLKNNGINMIQYWGLNEMIKSLLMPQCLLEKITYTPLKNQNISEVFARV